MRGWICGKGVGSRKVTVTGREESEDGEVGWGREDGYGRSGLTKGKRRRNDMKSGRG